MELSNDSEVERLGANATAVYALEFWNKLASAARQDGRILDPIWDYNNGGLLDSAKKNNGSTLQHQQQQSNTSATTKIVLTESFEADRRLYKRFRSNFGQLPVDKVSNATLGGPRWRGLLLACEGIVPSYNFMTLLREDVHDIFWMTEAAVSEGTAIVPRAQFLFLETTRIQEGLYASQAFRRNLQLWDVKCRSEDLKKALEDKNEAAVLEAIYLLQSQWPYAPPRVLKETGALKVVKLGWKTGRTEAVKEKCHDLLLYWKDLADLGKLRVSIAPIPSLERAGRALAAVQHQDRDHANSGNTNGRNTKLVTRTTSSLSDLLPQTMKSAPTIFRTFGMVVVEDFLRGTEVRDCLTAADLCLKDLVNEQLKPRGLVVDGSNSFDFDQVRQRPGHRVDNRYKVLDSPVVRKVKDRLLEQLPMLLTGTVDHQYKLLYGGVVHSFPRENKSDPLPDAQMWHRDGPSLFDSAHHETHCFNVFIPLIDVSTENGTTEFIPGSHNDDVFKETMVQLFANPKGHPLAVPARLDAGSMVVFDVRVLHRGLANASMKERPMMYFTLAQSWFQEEHMFDDDKKLVIDSKEQRNGVSPRDLNPANENGANPSASSRGVVSFSVGHLYELVSGRQPPVEASYGHPHYTTRFDMMLAEIENEESRIQNMNAILKLCSSGQQDNLANAFIDILRSPPSRKQKLEALEQARLKRKEARSKAQEAEEDFATFSTDMSDVMTLYALTAKLILKESWSISKLGFTEDQDGLLLLLATLKAYATQNTSTVKSASLEEAFSSWWHAGIGRFNFMRLNNRKTEAQRVIVVFSSLGSGIARPEWGGSLSKLAPSETLDVLHVLDPAFSWYCQDPSCTWKGGEYYYDELKKRLKNYQAVLFLGDSMGGAGALRFSNLAHAVLVFSPQVDICDYEAITRKDFGTDQRQQFEMDLLQACRETDARILVHYSEHCEADTNAVLMLPLRCNIKLVAHDFDDHILSLHLRKQGKLQPIIDQALEAFTTDKF